MPLYDTVHSSTDYGTVYSVLYLYAGYPPGGPIFYSLISLDDDISRVASTPRANCMVSRWFRGDIARFRGGFAVISRGFAPVLRVISRGFALISRGFARFRGDFADGFVVVSRGFARFREVSHT